MGVFEKRGQGGGEGRFLTAFKPRQCIFGREMLYAWCARSRRYCGWSRRMRRWGGRGGRIGDRVWMGKKVSR